MEQKVSEVLPRLLTPERPPGTAPSPTSELMVPADKTIALAFQSPKLFDSTDMELVDMIAVSVTRAFADTGKRNDQNLNEQIDYIIQTLPAALKRLFPSMRIKEIPIAINRGIYKEFGEYYGINVAEIVRFCRSHLESNERINTAKAVLKPNGAPLLPPSREAVFYLYKSNLLESFEKHKVGGNFESNGPSLYDFCNLLQLIIFSTKEKYDIMKEAALAIIKDQQNILFVTPDDFARKPHQNIIEILRDFLADEKSITGDIKGLLIAKSKFLTLKDFFNEVEMNELELAELVEKKKELFINT